MPRQLSRTVQPSFEGCSVVASQFLNAHFVIVIAVHSTLFVPRFLSHQDIEFFSAHSANRSYSSAILSIIALGWASFISSARARFSAARMRHTRAFCHDASDVMRWTPQKWEPQATVCAWGSVASLRLLGLSARGVGGWGGHPALAC